MGPGHGHLRRSEPGPGAEEESGRSGVVRQVLQRGQGALLLAAALVLAGVAPAAAATPAPCGAGEPLSRFGPYREGPAVALVQHALKQVGYDPGPADGRYGPRTTAAVRQFQQDHRLAADGVVGPRTRVALDQALAALPHAPFTPADERRMQILVDLRRNTLTLMVNGFAWKSWTVAPGTRRTPSPQGEWKIINKSRNWGGSFGSRWMGFNVPWGLYGIHGTDEPWLIGRDASHGCIRMRNREVEELYDLVPVGTPVLIYGDPILTRRTLVEGHTGADVAEVQVRLKELGYYQGPVDGRFGKGMRAAVLRFQRDRGLQPTGLVRYDTYRALGLGN